MGPWNFQSHVDPLPGCMTGRAGEPSPLRRSIERKNLQGPIYLGYKEWFSVAMFPSTNPLNYGIVLHIDVPTNSGRGEFCQWFTRWAKSCEDGEGGKNIFVKNRRNTLYNHPHHQRIKHLKATILGCWQEVSIIYDVCILIRDNLRLPQLTSVFFEWTPTVPTKAAWILYTVHDQFVHTSYMSKLRLLWKSMGCSRTIVHKWWVSIAMLNYHWVIIKRQLLEIGTGWHLIYQIVI